MLFHLSDKSVSFKIPEESPLPTRPDKTPKPLDKPTLVPGVPAKFSQIQEYALVLKAESLSSTARESSPTQLGLAKSLSPPTGPTEQVRASWDPGGHLISIRKNPNVISNIQKIPLWTMAVNFESMPTQDSLFQN